MEHRTAYHAAETTLKSLVRELAEEQIKRHKFKGTFMLDASFWIHIDDDPFVDLDRKSASRSTASLHPSKAASSAAPHLHLSVHYNRWTLTRTVTKRQSSQTGRLQEYLGGLRGSGAQVGW